MNLSSKQANKLTSRPRESYTDEEWELIVAENRIKHDINFPPIDITKLVVTDHAREVVYVPYHERWKTHPLTETGVISSWNDKFIFVKFYDGYNGDYDTTSKACSPIDLHFK